MSAWARSPMVLTAKKSLRVFLMRGPKPNSFSTFKGQYFSGISSLVMSVRPLGFFKSAAVLATTFELAIPILHIMFSSSLTLPMICLAIDIPSPKSFSQPVVSTNASSIENTSTKGRKSLVIFTARIEKPMYKS